MQVRGGRGRGCYWRLIYLVVDSLPPVSVNLMREDARDGGLPRNGSLPLHHVHTQNTLNTRTEDRERTESESHKWGGMGTVVVLCFTWCMIANIVHTQF